MQHASRFVLAALFVASLALSVGCAAPSGGAAAWPDRIAPAPQGDPYATPEAEATYSVWSDNHPRGTFYARVGTGSFEREVKNPNGSVTDSVSAVVSGVMIEGGNVVGGGFITEFLTTSDPLYDDLTFGNGSDATTLDLFPYFLVRVKGGSSFRMPIRIGVWLNFFTLDQIFGTTSGDTQAFTYGARLALEPEYDVYKNENMNVSVYALLQAGIGKTKIEDDVDSADTDSTSVGFDIGARFNWKLFAVALSYVRRQVNTDQSDPADSGNVFLETNNTFSGGVLSVGIRW